MKKVFALSAAAAFGLTGAVMAYPSVTVDLSGLTSNDLQGAPGNVTLTVPGIGVGDIIESVDYDVNASGVGVSWFEEVTYSLWDGSVGGGLAADGSGGALSYAPGAQTSFYVNSAAAGNHDIADYVMNTSTLVIELHEWNFDDEVGPDAFYNDGSSLTINYVPAPAGLALLGIAGLAGRRRRR